MSERKEDMPEIHVGNNRDEKLAQTFVELADTLVTGFDLVDFLSMLCERCIDLVDASAVGVLIADPSSRLHVMASSTEQMRMLELFEVQHEEGPCRDAVRNASQVLNERLDDNEKWPRFAPLALASGFEMAHAFPLRLRTEIIGGVNMFQTTVRPFGAGEATIAQALADAATIAILQERSGREKTELAEQLQWALNSRVIVEQSKGVLAERLNVETDVAFRLLRNYARHHNERLIDVANKVLSGELRDASAWTEGRSQ